MKRVLCVLAIGAAACGWQHHDLTPRAQAVVISKAEPVGYAMVGTFFTYKDCLSGMGTGNTDEDAQMECIKWKTDAKGGNYAVLDTAVGDGYYKGRIYACHTAPPARAEAAAQ